MKAARGRDEPLPLWNTETGTTSRTFYRRLPDRRVDPYTLWLHTLPYNVAGSLMDGTRGCGWLELPGPALASLVEDDAWLVAVVWRRGGQRVRPLLVPLEPAAVEVRDLMGGAVTVTPRDARFELPVGAEPLYVIVPSARGEQLIGALRKARRIHAPGGVPRPASPPGP